MKQKQILPHWAESWDWWLCNYLKKNCAWLYFKYIVPWIVKYLTFPLQSFFNYFKNTLLINILVSIIHGPVFFKTASLWNNRELFRTLDFTARKRSLGQGNVFRSVCLSTGGLCPGGSRPHPPPRQRPPPCYGKENAVRILLECILFIFTISKCVEE